MSLSVASGLVYEVPVSGFVYFYATRHKQDLFLSVGPLHLDLTGCNQDAASLPIRYISS